MSRLSFPVICCCAALTAIPLPAEAAPAKRSAERPVSFLDFWRQRIEEPAPPPSAARRSGRAAPRNTAKTSCLPGQIRSKLSTIEARFGRVQVISTNRPGARIRGGRPSLHASCRAVDFRPAPGSYSRVAAYLRNSWNGGVGTYASGHIHIDTGQRFRWHVGGSTRSKRRR